MVTEWLALFRNEDGAWETLGSNVDLPQLKTKLEPEILKSNFLVFVPELEGGKFNPMSDKEYFDLVSHANEGQISSVIRTDDPVALEAELKRERPDRDIELCPTRCFTVVYSTDSCKCECLAGASGRGVWRVCFTCGSGSP